MIGKYEEALICDLAETYQIYDYRQLPPSRVAVFSIGLRDNSRIKMKLNDQKVSMETSLLAGIVDRLSLLVWAQTKEGQKGVKRPTMILDSLTSKENKDSDVIVFESGKDFKKMRNEILAQAGGE